jgi:CheY-like chemotaxis protein
MEAIGTLAAGIAHDFNNLLTAISGYADLAKSVLASEHPAHQYLDVVESAVRDAGGIANSLLTFSRKTTTAKAPVDLRKVLGDSLKLLRRLLPASIEVQASWSEDLPIFVDADVGQMHQVLMNLVTNARDAMPEGGTLRISLTAEGPAAVTGRDSAGRPAAALLVVEDTGVGMTRGVVAKIFDPFFTTKPRSKGTGLGMAMVHGIIERHGGRIEVDSKPGEGTRVSIHLPCCEPPAETAAEQIVATVAARGQNILLAEDDEYVRSLIAQALRGAGYKVADVASGTALLERFRAAPESIALVVLDLDLPRMGGLHCLHEVRKLRPNMPAILITGSPEVAINEDKDKQATMFRKPFKMSALTQAVHRAIAQGPGGSE